VVRRDGFRTVSCTRLSPQDRSIERSSAWAKGREAFQTGRLATYRGVEWRVTWTAEQIVFHDMICSWLSFGPGNRFSRCHGQSRSFPGPWACRCALLPLRMLASGEVSDMSALCVSGRGHRGWKVGHVDVPSSHSGCLHLVRWVTCRRCAWCEGLNQRVLTVRRISVAFPYRQPSGSRKSESFVIPNRAVPRMAL